MKRREFFKNMMGLTGAAALAPLILSTFKSSIASAQEGGGRKKAGGADSDMVDPKTDATAKAVQYMEASKTKDKSCANCAMYAKTEVRKGKEVGTCALFPKKLVLGKGYCNSWAKKA